MVEEETGIFREREPVSLGEKEKRNDTPCSGVSEGKIPQRSRKEGTHVLFFNENVLKALFRRDVPHGSNNFRRTGSAG